MTNTMRLALKANRLALWGSEGDGGTGTPPPGETPPNTGTPPVIESSTPPADPPEPNADMFPRSYVEQLRAEAAASRVKAKETEARLKELEDRDLSEMEKAKKTAEEATKEREQLRAELISTRRQSLVHKIAASLNFNDPDDAIALLPELEPGDDGLPSEKAVKGALETILKSKPYLAAVQSPGTGDGGGRGTAPTPPSDDKAQQYQAEYEKKGGVRLPQF